MTKYVVTITKICEMEVEAENREMADEIARDQEAEGSAHFDMTVEVRAHVIGGHPLNHWMNILAIEHNVSVYEARALPGFFGFTGCTADHYPSLDEAVEAAVIQYGLAASAGPDRDDVAEWVGLHYKVNFESEPEARQTQWIERYQEAHAETA